MQIKIISDQVRHKGGIAEYIGEKDLYYKFNDNSCIEDKVNKFCKEHEVVSVTPSIATLGNNPPTACIIYTIVYNK